MDLWDEFSFLENGPELIDYSTLYGWCLENGERGQLLLQELDIECNYKEGLDIDAKCLARATNKKVWWRCSKCDNVFLMPVAKRTYYGRGCPKCGIKKSQEYLRDPKRRDKTSLREYVNSNNIDNGVLKEWDYQSNSKINLTPDNVCYGSNQEAYFICEYCIVANYMYSIIWKQHSNCQIAKNKMVCGQCKKIEVYVYEDMCKITY